MTRNKEKEGCHYPAAKKVSGITATDKSENNGYFCWSNYLHSFKT